jgi:hypothetical protein
MKRILFSMIVLMNSVSIAYGQLSVVSHGDTTEIWDSNFSWSCGGRFFPIIEITQGSIKITECDTMGRTTCDCNFSVCTKFSDLDTGTYTVRVARQWKYHMRFPRDTVIEYYDFVGSLTMTITKAPTKQTQVGFYQGPCIAQSVDEGSSIPNNYFLLTNYPNPFNPSTVIRYKVPSTAHVVVAIYDLAGQRIAILVDGEKDAGSYDITYGAAHLSSGIYICRLIAGVTTISSKMILIK